MERETSSAVRAGVDFGPDGLEVVAGRDRVVRFHIERHFMFVFEIESEALRPYLWDGLVLKEVVPGISLLHLACLRYFPGNFGPDSGNFYELVLLSPVMADLTVEMPTPWFAFLPLNIGSDSHDFVRHDGEVLRLPTRHMPGLELSFDPDGLGVRAEDDEGPIFELRNTLPEPRFEHTVLWGQHLPAKHGRQFFGIWEWDGLLNQHQSKAESPGKLYPHSYFRGIDVQGAIQDCYMQMTLKPGEEAFERFWEIEDRGPVDRGAG
jgi:hypothetical protein